MDRKEALKYQVFCGVDVGKATNYVVALGRDDDERLVSRAVEQTETDMHSAPATHRQHRKKDKRRRFMRRPPFILILDKMI